MVGKRIANHLCGYAIKLRPVIFCAVYRIVFLNDRMTFFERIQHILPAEFFCKTFALILLWDRSADPVYILIKCKILFLQLQLFQGTTSRCAGSVCHIHIHHTNRTFASAQNHIQLFQIVCIDIPKVKNYDFVIFCVFCTLDDLHGNPAEFLPIPTTITHADTLCIFFWKLLTQIFRITKLQKSGLVFRMDILFSVLLQSLWNTLDIIQRCSEITGNIFQHFIGVRTQIDLDDTIKNTGQHLHRIVQAAGCFCIQCDRIMHTPQYNCRIKRSRKVIRSSKLIYLSYACLRCFWRDTDNRKRIKPLFFFHHFQNFISIHHRHIQIKKHNLICFPLLFQYIDGFPATFGHVNLILCFQHRRQNFSVYFRIIYY